MKFRLGGCMERMDFDEIKQKMDEYFKNLGYEVEFGTKDDYKTVIPFRVLDKNKKVVIPEQSKAISEIPNSIYIDSYFSWLKSRLKSG